MHEKEVHTMLDQVIAWGNALKPLHTKPLGDDRNARPTEGIEKS